MSRSHKSTPATTHKTEAARLLLRLALFGVLGLVLIAAGYDFLFARNQATEAFHQLERLDKQRSDLAVPLTDADVHELMKFEPEKSHPNHLTKVEYYRWSSVVPMRQYWVWVAYRMTVDDQWQVDSYGCGGEPRLAPLEQPAVSGPQASPAAGDGDSAGGDSLLDDSPPGGPLPTEPLPTEPPPTGPPPAGPAPPGGR